MLTMARLTEQLLLLGSLHSLMEEDYIRSGGCVVNNVVKFVVFEQSLTSGISKESP